jgi:hypothetical protein
MPGIVSVPWVRYWSPIDDRCGGSQRTPLPSRLCGTSQYRDGSDTKSDPIIDQFLQFSWYIASPLLLQYVDTINFCLKSFKSDVELKNTQYHSVPIQIMFAIDIYATHRQFWCSCTFLDSSRTRLLVCKILTTRELVLIEWDMRLALICLSIYQLIQRS